MGEGGSSPPTNESDPTVEPPSEGCGLTDEAASTTVLEAVSGHQSTDVLPQQGFSISAEIARKVTFATEQAGIPILRDLVIANHGEEDLEAIDVEISADPPFLRSRVWRIDRIIAGSDFSMRDRRIELDGGFLFGLTEAMSGTVTVKARRAGVGDSSELISEERHRIRILARNEWGGAGTMPELLASFVQPSDPGSERLVKAAAETLRTTPTSDANHAVNGYQSGSREAVWRMANALWVAIGQLRLDYSVPPASFEVEGQKIRKPADVLSSGLATCLDSVILFASALEQMGLHPLAILVKDHAFVGVWLAPEKFASVVGEDVVDVRKRVDLGDILVFESTLAVQHPPAPFSRAVEHAKRTMRELDEADPYFRVIDVTRARALGYTPLPSFEAPHLPGVDGAGTGPVTLSMETPPALPEFDRQVDATAVNTPDGRIERWKRKLLDLSLRNKMLSWKAGRSSVAILCRDVPRLEDLLAEGREFRVKDLPDLGLGTREGSDGRRDETIVRRKLGEPAVDIAVDEGLGDGLLYADLTAPDLEARLIELFRKARSDLQEGGANTLFLAAGMLRWKKSATDTSSYRAPLILIPVQIERKSVRAPLRIKHHDDEPRFNATLLEMLRTDFQITIPALEGELPTDDSGIDLPRVFTLVREAVKDTAGFEVEADQLVLSTFSFAKYLMWKDLQDRTDQLKENPLVRHLIDTPRESFTDGVSFPDAGELDQRYAPKDLYLVKPADSSQLRAVAAGAEGKNFVLIGPPGTGKSQTITNLIAQSLGMGRRVLFFAEKTAALEVVYRRLQEEGLGDFCLEVHSNKARKTDVLEQLERAWEVSATFTEEQWTREAERLAELRDQLNGFVAALHRRHGNGWSAFQALSTVIAGEGLDAPKLSWPSIDQHRAQDYENIERIAEDLQVSGKEVRDLTGTVFEAIAQSEWSPGFQNDVVERAQRVIACVDRCLDAERRLLEATSLTAPLEGRARRRDYWERGLVRLAEALLVLQGLSCDLAFSSGLNELVAERERLVETLRAYASARARLSTSYKEGAETRLPLDTLYVRAQEARSAWWPKSAFLLRPAAKALQTEIESGTVAKGAAREDLAAMRDMRGHRRTIDADFQPLAGRLGRVWKGVASDPNQVTSAIDRLVTVRDATSSLAGDVERIGRVQSVLTPLLTTAQDMLAPTGSVGAAAQDLREAFAALRSALDEFEHVAHGRIDRDSPSDSAAGWLESLRIDATTVVEGAAAINRWCNWRRDRISGEARGLGPVLAGVEAGSVGVDRIVETVRLAYARWWLDGVVEQDETLKKFSASRHEHTIQRFRELDDRFHSLTRQFLRAKIASGTPARDGDHRGTEYSVLQRELTKRRNHKPLRQLISEMPTALLSLTPCLLMSPLSVAQYLAASDDLFDVAIVDEGSQVTVWDAVGPLARAKQAIIVGDPKQLPPTSFFQRADDEEAPSDEATEEDLESILDEAIGANVPTLNLEWHYRSRSESLIAFSNQQYYGNRLVTFPSPRTDDMAVRLIRVKQGLYERGKGGTRTNPAEARAIVSEITGRLLAQAHLPRQQQLSYGVVTFNAEQQRLIEDLLDEEVRKTPEIEPFFDITRPEPVMVKNLESVQGDERDVMMFSITYGPDQTGRLSMNFGPLNRQGGERRLNVAITRARSELLVFSSIGAGDIDLSRTAALGVHDLKHFLDYAERGVRALGEIVTGSMGSFESPFEAAVSEALTNRGWRVIPQVGVGGFRIDLGVVHPDEPGRFLAGIEADGATYHAGRTARDRDKLRELVLRSLGWQIIRIWSTDWWIDRRSALSAVDARLRELLEADRARVHEELVRADEDEERRLHQEAATAGPKSDEDEVDDAAPDVFPAVRMARSATTAPPAQSSSQSGTTDIKKYHRIQDIAERFGITDGEVSAFMTELIRPRVAEVLGGVVDVEGPVERLDVISRVAKGFGFKKAGSRIRAYIEECMPPRPETVEDDVTYLWPAGSHPNVIPFRTPATDEDIRYAKSIPIEELVGLAKSLPNDITDDAAVDRMARAIGIARITAGARERLQRAWTLRTS